MSKPSRTGFTARLRPISDGAAPDNLVTRLTPTKKCTYYAQQQEVMPYPLRSGLQCHAITSKIKKRIFNKESGFIEFGIGVSGFLQCEIPDTSADAMHPLGSSALESSITLGRR